MRGVAASMTVLRPRTAREALAAYGRTPEALPIVGGTDIMVLWNLGELNGRTMLDLSRLAEWGRIERLNVAGEGSVTVSSAPGRNATSGSVTGGSVTDDNAIGGATAGGGAHLRIGALATHTALQRDRVVRQRFGLLAEACATVGGVQIQNRGTIGGNVANASPAGDTLPALAVYDAIVHVASASGRRAVPFLDIFKGVKKTTLGPGELIEAIDLPLPSRAPDRQLFRKVGTRAAQAISKTVVSGLLWLAKDGTVQDVRLALGSMAPTVRRLGHVEAALVGKRPTADVVRDAVALLPEDVSPIDDVRSTAAYRMLVSQQIVAGFMAGVP